jgi:potassium efflux system protein
VRILPILAILATLGWARAEQAPTPVGSVGDKEVVIGINDAPARVEEVHTRLRRILDRARPVAAVTEIEGALPQVSASIADHARRDGALLESRVDLVQLSSMQARWAQNEALLAGWDVKLGRSGEQLDRLVGEVDDLQRLWEQTAEQLRDAAAPPELLGRVTEALATIRHARDDVTKRRDRVLRLRNQVARQQAVVADIAKLIEERNLAVLSDLWVRDQPTLWHLYRNPPATPLPLRVREAFASELDDLWEFLRSERAGGPIALGTIVLLVAMMQVIARQSRRWRSQGHDLEQAAIIAERPVAAAIMLWVLVLPWLNVPMVVRRLASLILVVPLIRLLRPLLHEVATPLVGLLVPLLVVDRLGDTLAPVPEISRPLSLVEMAIAVAALRWFRRTWLDAADERPPKGGRWTDRVARSGEIALVVAALANVLGYQQLSDLLGDTVIAAGYVALTAWVIWRVLSGMVAVAVRSRPLSALHLVQRNQNRVAGAVRRFARVALILVWVMVVLRFAHLWNLLLGTLTGLLDAPLGVGNLAFTLADVLLLAGSVWGSFLIARAVRAILEEEILSRVHLPRGIPYAVSTFASYAVLVIGVIMAFLAAGFDLSRITIVLGALGVGVGLGLQEIVKDLVAGTVLLFERPIQLGDIVQMGDLTGDVRRIGLRSSTVHTFDGAEVIVPNSSFTSSQIVNWTLSDRMRRVDLPVGVAYGTDPARVIALLEELARRHPDSLVDPEPRALFMGFGESSLDFQLRCWTDRFDQVVVFRSELAIAVNAALLEAGITVPFPQRDLHVQSLPPELAGGTRRA